ncbi:MAG: gamma-glutamyl-gamma-aminobutyrate hydrolase family protein [Actinomycetota bacterium]|nr:gamma-glutamyl-gamma-aminobutyrate hydrolase family protein [Actinomycetota bacterium]
MSDLDNTTTPRRIAITSGKVINKDIGRFPGAYVEAVRLSHGVPIVLSPFPTTRWDEAVPPGVSVLEGIAPGDLSPLDGASGLILTGGGDVDPALYSQRHHRRTRNISTLRDAFESGLLGAALERDLPVLAICRGMQLLNVFLGGRLDQHLAERTERLPHDRDRPRDEVAHEVGIAEGTVLAGILGAPRLGVNSHHHQGLDGAADGLEEIAWADDGVLEAVVSTEYSWVLGVQWHPEAMIHSHPVQRRLFEALIQAASAWATAGAARH